MAFYLPQFHPIPENDQWWGEGFTEWRNVIRGRPRFVGHYQPHLPGELGFYDLRSPGVQARQIELARLYGVGGFVFYFYWFEGKRLLEQPLQQYLGDSSLDFPFCLCWANESWTRRWDGRQHEVLISQAHSAADDVAFIAHAATYMRDGRYIRLHGRPLLLVYRPELLPDPKATTLLWRQWCRDNGVGDIFLAYTQSFTQADPEKYGFDAAVEFPPNNTDPPELSDDLEFLDSAFQGVVFDWTFFLKRSREYRDPGYRIFRCVNPGWDNEARRPGCGAVFFGASPTAYREWLCNAIADTWARLPDPDERLVFVNAWNEWAEGAHLEPDQRYGYAYLQATRDALAAVPQRWRRSILIVSHDARPHGAQLLSLHICRELSQNLGYRVYLLLLGTGPLLADYEQYADVWLIDEEKGRRKALQSYATQLHSRGLSFALVNSTASAHCIPALKSAGIRVTLLVHELPALLRAHGLEANARLAAANATKLVFPTTQVRDSFQRFGRINEETTAIRAQGLYKRNSFKLRDNSLAREKLRRRLGLDPRAQVVLAVGYGDHRKGFDLFVAAGITACRRSSRAVFVWVGLLDPTLEAEGLSSIEAAGMLSRFLFPGHGADTDLFYAGANLYAMTSREDPFPSVVLEALNAGLPVVAYSGSGGCDALQHTGCVVLAPPLDVSAYADHVVSLLGDERRMARIAVDARSFVQREHSFRRYVIDLLALAGDAPPRVSIIVPNYNYRRYLPERVASIVGQTVPPYELIFLDDASTDGSVEWSERHLEDLFPDAQSLINRVNSGSVFEQWLRGVEQARGDYVWIAEADDLCEPDFLSEVLAPFSDPGVVLSFCQSKQIDEEGCLLADDYQDYLAEVSEEKWRSYHVNDGVAEIRSSLSVKNTIPNVSATVFRRSVLLEVLQLHIGEIRGYRFAGDWFIYVEVLRRGDIAFSPRSLNCHRRHDRGVTIKSFGGDHLREVLAIQSRILDQFRPDQDTVNKGRRYAERLRKQFGIRGSLPSLLAPEVGVAKPPTVGVPPGQEDLTGNT